jgi:hypothetical protein
MPASTNKNAPRAEYEPAVTNCGAAYRPSITFAQATTLLGNNPVLEARLRKCLTTRPKESNATQFTTDPWSACRAKGWENGRWERRVDRTVGWRAVRFDGAWFLAKHVTGGNDRFEFWHISDPPGKCESLPSIGAVGSTVPMKAPVVTTTTPLTSVNMTGTVPVIAKVSEQSTTGQAPSGTDAWD